MRVKFTLLITLILCFVSSYSFSKEISKSKDWKVHKSVDQMTGKSDIYIKTIADKKLRGSIDSHYLNLVYHCQGGFSLFTYGDLEIDDISCSEYGCNQYHYARIRIDENEPLSTKWQIYGDNTNSMWLRYSRDFKEDKFLKMVKRGNAIKVEITAMNTRSDVQYPVFSLSGFTKAVSHCN